MKPSFTGRAIVAACLVWAAATSHAAGLDLNDCKVLLGEQRQAEYKSWKARAMRLSAQGDAQATHTLAAEANNRLACHEEALTGDDGWTMSVSSGEGAARSSETTVPSGLAAVQRNPAAFNALKEAIRYTHQAGATDPGYKSRSAQLVVRYLAAVPDTVEAAYEDAAGAYEFDCVLKRAYENRVTAVACSFDRFARALLLPQVPAERRKLLDAAARDWAEHLVAP